MTRDQIIKLARQASIGNEDRNIFFDFLIEELEAFAHLVAEHEREACALICEELKYDGYEMVKDNPVLARKIRARNNT